MKIKTLFAKISVYLLAMLLIATLMFQFSSCKKDDEDPSFTLTVENGTGSGTYQLNTVVSISANDPATGMEFDQWTGDVARVADVNSANTTIKMPASNASVTATYADILYTLTVESGSGGGEYAGGAEVAIEAGAAPDGMYFDKWTGDVDYVEDVEDPTTTVTMPLQNVTVTAAYTDIPAPGMLAGTWKIAKYYEAVEGDAWEEIQSAANDGFRLTFNFDEDYNPTTYEMILGSVLEVPNYNSDMNSGDWTIDDLNEPTQITYDPTDTNPSINLLEGIPTESSLIIYWTIDYDIEEKPSKNVKMELIPE